MRKRMAILMALVMLLCTVPSTASASGFSDIKEGAWYQEYVSYLVAEGGIKGYPDGSFGPSRTITGAEFVAIVVRTTVGDQEQTGEHWASGIFEAAYEAGMLPEGMLPEEDWDKPISREKMAVIIAKTSENVLKEEAAKTAAVEDKISDLDACCVYCKDHVLQVYAKYIINGYPDGSFGPQKNLTRAEATTVVVRLLNEEYRKPPAAAVVTDGIDFDPATDIRADGTMEEAKAIEYMDKLLATLKYTGSNGEYYVEGTFPELPEGFRWSFFTSVRYDLDLNKPIWSASTGEHKIPDPDRMISGEGYFKKPVKGMESVEQVGNANFDFGIWKENGYGYAGYIFGSSNDNLQLYHENYDPAFDYDYDVSKHFLWE